MEGGSWDRGLETAGREETKNNFWVYLFEWYVVNENTHAITCHTDTSVKLNLIRQEILSTLKKLEQKTWINWMLPEILFKHISGNEICIHMELMNS